MKRALYTPSVLKRVFVLLLLVVGSGCLRAQGTLLKEFKFAETVAAVYPSHDFGGCHPDVRSDIICRGYGLSAFIFGGSLQIYNLDGWADFRIKPMNITWHPEGNSYYYYRDDNASKRKEFSTVRVTNCPHTGNHIKLTIWVSVYYFGELLDETAIDVEAGSDQGYTFPAHVSGNVEVKDREKRKEIALSTNPGGFTFKIRTSNYENNSCECCDEVARLSGTIKPLSSDNTSSSSSTAKISGSSNTGSSSSTSKSSSSGSSSSSASNSSSNSSSSSSSSSSNSSSGSANTSSSTGEQTSSEKRRSHSSSSGNSSSSENNSSSTPATPKYADAGNFRISTPNSPADDKLALSARETKDNIKRLWTLEKLELAESEKTYQVYTNRVRNFNDNQYCYMAYDHYYSEHLTGNQGTVETEGFRFQIKDIESIGCVQERGASHLSFYAFRFNAKNGKDMIEHTTTINGNKKREMTSSCTVYFTRQADNYCDNFLNEELYQNLNHMRMLAIKRDEEILASYTSSKIVAYRTAHPTIEKRTLRFNNDRGELKLLLYSPDNPTQPKHSWDFQFKENLFVAENGVRTEVGSDWGIQRDYNGDRSKIRFVGDIAEVVNGAWFISAGSVDMGSINKPELAAPEYNSQVIAAYRAKNSLTPRRINIRNAEWKNIDILLYHPDNLEKVFSRWTFKERETNPLMYEGKDLYVGGDWGIQIEKDGQRSKVALVGDICYIKDDQFQARSGLLLEADRWKDETPELTSIMQRIKSYQLSHTTSPRELYIKNDLPGGYVAQLYEPDDLGTSHHLLLKPGETSRFNEADGTTPVSVKGDWAVKIYPVKGKDINKYLLVGENATVSNNTYYFNLSKFSDYISLSNSSTTGSQSATTSAPSQPVNPTYNATTIAAYQSAHAKKTDLLTVENKTNQSFKITLYRPDENGKKSKSFTSGIGEGLSAGDGNGGYLTIGNDWGIQIEMNGITSKTFFVGNVCYDQSGFFTTTTDILLHPDQWPKQKIDALAPKQVKAPSSFVSYYFRTEQEGLIERMKESHKLFFSHKLNTDYQGSVKVSFYKPESPTQPYSSWTFPYKMENYILINKVPLTIKGDWGIQIEELDTKRKSKIFIVADIASTLDGYFSVSSDTFFPAE